jgi:Fe-S cluster assembly iron-binding protein IscA
MSDAAAILEDCQRRLEKVRKGAGSWFRGGDVGLNHGQFHAQLAPYHDRVFYEGRVTWASLVMAQPVLFNRGNQDSTGTCVYSFDKQFSADPQALIRIAGLVGALKRAMPKDPILIAFAAEVRNDEPREIDRMVPPSLTQGRQVRYETIYLQRNRMPTAYLAHTLVPIIISQSQPTQPMLLPLDFWPPELIEQWQELALRNPPTDVTPVQQGPITKAGYQGGGPKGYDPYLDDNVNSGSRYGAGGGSGSGYGSGAGTSAGMNSGYSARPDDNPGRFGTPSQTAARGQSYPAQIQPQPQPSTMSMADYDDAPAAHAGHPAHAQAQGQAQGHSQGQGGMSPEDAFAQNPMRLTSNAAAVLRLMLRQQGMANGKVRVTVVGRGCQLAFTEEDPDRARDFMYACDGITLLVDRDSASVLAGVQMDLPTTPQAMGFVFSRVA